MYEWLTTLLAEVHTPRFFLTNITSDVEHSLTTWPVTPPRSYQTFIQSFGAVQLFREQNFYQLQIFQHPAVCGERLAFGSLQSSYVSWEYRRGTLNNEPHVILITRDGSIWQNTHITFEEWLRNAVLNLRSTYLPSEWKAICRGPRPFSIDDERIVAIRRRFEIVRYAYDNGQYALEIQNRSDGHIPFLTLNVTYPDDRRHGGKWVPVGHIHPGESSKVTFTPSKGVSHPDNAIIEIAPDPRPEDREMYWEFRRWDASEQ